MEKQAILSALNEGTAVLSFPQDAAEKVLKNPVISSYVEAIGALAETYRGTPIPVLSFTDFRRFEESGDRLIFEDGKDAYFPRRGRLAMFAVLSWLYGRREDLQELEDIIWAICDEYTWSLPAHLQGTGLSVVQNDGYMVDLFASETAQALAEIKSMLGDKLPPIICRRIDRLVNERVLDRVLEADFGWMTTTNNWAAVCAGSVGMAAIYTLQDDPEKLAAVLERILPAFDHFLSGFAKDGACLEGITYWSYGFSYFVSFADMLLRRTNGKIDLFAPEIVHKVATFQQKCYFKGGRAISFADGHSDATFHPGLTSYLSRKYDDVIVPDLAYMMHLGDDHCYRFSNIMRDLVWAVDHVEKTSAEACYVLPDAQWYVCSSGSGVGIAAKGGHNNEPHNHNDIGNFQIFKNGEEMFADLGGGEYTRQYFSETRYTFFVCGSQGHNVPMIDGNCQLPGEDKRANDVTIDENGISMDIAAAYALEDMPSLKRAVSFDKATGKTTITDAFTFTGGKHEVRERFVTYGNAQYVDGGLRIYNGKETMFLRYDHRMEPTLHAQEFSAHMGIHSHVLVIDFVAQAEDGFEVTFTIE